MWWTQVQRDRTNQIYNLQFHYGPRDLEDIPVIGNVDTFTSYNATYVSFDPDQINLGHTALASAELSLNLGQVLGILPIAACTRNITDICFISPIITCNSRRPAIIMEPSDHPEVIKQGEGCIRILGNGTDLVRSTDRLLLEWYGVMQVE